MDFYIEQSKFHQQFAEDVSKSKASLMSACQRPTSEAAGTPAWTTLSLYFVACSKTQQNNK